MDVTLRIDFLPLTINGISLQSHAVSVNETILIIQSNPKKGFLFKAPHFFFTTVCLYELCLKIRVFHTAFFKHLFHISLISSVACTSTVICAIFFLVLLCNFSHIFWSFPSVAQNHTLHFFCLKKTVDVSKWKPGADWSHLYIYTMPFSNWDTFSVSVFVHNSVCV